ncbi:MAG: EAL domain-containing protein [Candidatus Thiodiazotropha sp. (ex Ctena orbiculata)]|nr:EAL domain-containing protein [Candidatus Thiodiazotropha taylori]MBT2998845.1 EAL domain-containing protein [Candidatus Thiodiazotropha taylori]MBT3002176.1 EAL domain-containing protein [Candidatus Thiodiazotropha taylori]MBT3026403.1 EAL domain-containing protein [Candidatus Thiodiazotropha taylori]MBT3034475.1 EAL domain-containing protein [Candidatus Thiodiazotropha taylori]
MKQTTIFRHLFKRIALILLGVNLIFSIVLLPLYNDKLIRMIAIQGETFSHSTIAACSEALYTEDYSFVISYVRKVLKQSPEITFVTFTSTKGIKIKLTGDEWNVENLDRPFDYSLFKAANPYTIEHVKNIDSEADANEFVFSKPINISGLEWGIFTLGLSDTEYEALKSSYFTNVLVFSFVLLFISLLLLHGSSLKLGQQLSRLRDTANRLANGELSARAPTDAIGEVSVLASTLNGMAKSLDNNTQELRRLARLVEDTNDAIAIFDSNDKIIFVNAALKKIISQTDDYFSGMTLFTFLSHLKVGRNKQREIAKEFSNVDQHDWSTDITISTINHELTHMTMRIERFDIDEVDSGGYFVILSDITRRKQLEHELEVLAYIDKLTKLPNRRYFMDQLTEAVEKSETFDSGLAVIFLDLDNFKIINDSLGHEIGDVVLGEAGWRIQDALRSDDIVCRLGGDEFTAIIKGIKNKKSIGQIAAAILKRFQVPYYCNDRELRVSASIGVVVYPDDGLSTKELIKNADTAMYAAKKSGKNAFRFFSEEMHHDIRDFLDIESSLRQAINSNGLYLAYQPFVNSENREIHHCEALLRWKHPERGLIPPGKFIPIAEQAGLIGDIGKWVFDKVCRQIKAWKFDITVSINVSGTELLDNHFAERLNNTLIEHDVSPHHIQLEFTEHVLVSKEGKNLPILNQLKRIGFGLAVDDFGTGFSSLSYLTELPVDVIKIDKSFINRIPHDRKTVAVSNSIISLAHDLEIVTIGEGVENQDQVEWLRAHNCKLIQGYYFHKPMSADELEGLIKTTNVTLIDVHRKKREKT